MSVNSADRETPFDLLIFIIIMVSLKSPLLGVFLLYVLSLGRKAWCRTSLIIVYIYVFAGAMLTLVRIGTPWRSYLGVAVTRWSHVTKHTEKAQARPKPRVNTKPLLDPGSIPDLDP